MGSKAKMSNDNVAENQDFKINGIIDPGQDDGIKVVEISNKANKSKEDQLLDVKKSAKEIQEDVTEDANANENISGEGDTGIPKNEKGNKPEKGVGEVEPKAMEVSVNVEDLSKGANTIRIEKHKVHIIEHNLVVSGVNVLERKERTIVTQEDIDGNVIGAGNPIKTIVCHSRTIGNRKYAIKETKDCDGKTMDSKVITEMSDTELKAFEEDWKDYWIPTITDEQIESGEFEKELKELELKEDNENVTLKESEENEIQMEPVEVVIDKSKENESNFRPLYAKELTNADELETKDTPIEIFVKRNPLKVFYFGVAMLIMAILIFQCCFLPDYPPCSWFKCILGCIEKTNLGNSDIVDIPPLKTENSVK